MSMQEYREQIENSINTSIASFGYKTPLRDACEYALRNGGKRFRPSIVLMMSNAIGKGADVVQAALSIEYFHTASLIADDLPCMDNDDFRSDSPSLHKKFNEAIALLASYALISEGYGAVAKNARALAKSDLGFASEADHRCVLILENITFNTGLSGAVGGQFSDLFPSDLSLNTVLEIIQQKTGSLFEIAFVAGWLFGGGAVERLPQVKTLAQHFGNAFQIADDLGDREQDVKNNRSVNVANLFGVEKASLLVQENVLAYQRLLKELHIDTEELLSLVAPLEASTLSTG